VVVVEEEEAIGAGAALPDVGLGKTLLLLLRGGAEEEELASLRELLLSAFTFLEGGCCVDVEGSPRARFCFGGGGAAILSFVLFCVLIFPFFSLPLLKEAYISRLEEAFYLLLLLLLPQRMVVRMVVRVYDICMGDFDVFVFCVKWIVFCLKEKK